MADDYENLDKNSKAVFKKSKDFKSLNYIKKELLIKANEKNSLKEQGKILVNIVKNQGEVLLSTSY